MTYKTMRISGNMQVVTEAVKSARNLALTPYYIRASATDTKIIWVAEVKADNSLQKLLSEYGWKKHTPSLPKSQRLRDDSKLFKPVEENGETKKRVIEKPNSSIFKRKTGVLEPAHFKMMEERRLERAARGVQKPISSETTFEIRVILFSKRSFKLDQELRCSNCYKIKKPVFRYKESTEGQVYLCERCREHIYERSHGSSSNDAMHRAVMRKRSYG